MLPRALGGPLRRGWTAGVWSSRWVSSPGWSCSSFRTTSTRTGPCAPSSRSVSTPSPPPAPARPPSASSGRCPSRW